MSTRRGGIPGPESRTGLVRPAMTEAEFERQQTRAQGRDRLGDGDPSRPDADSSGPEDPDRAAAEPDRDRERERERDKDREPAPTSRGSSRGRNASRGRAPAAKPKRVQRMFAIEEELDKKLWLYAIHMGKDRSEVVNDLLRPLVSSMVLYDSRDRRNARGASDNADDDSES